jgi:hypothetical protein
MDGVAASADDGYSDLQNRTVAAASETYDYEYGETANSETGEYSEPSQLPTEATPVEDASEMEVIRERFPNGSIRIEREVTQDADGNYINHGS